jgi:hypothetical protein
MKTDRTTLGLLVLLAALVVLALFSASLPVMADYQAEQNITVAKSETLLIRNQTGVENVTYWNFTATIGTNSTTVNNSKGESQNPSDNSTPLARIENPNSALDLIIYLNASIFSPDIVQNEWYNVTNTTDNTGAADGSGISTALPFDTDTDTGNTIYATEFRNLWLKIYADQSGTATSTFKVLGEGA